MPEMTPEDARRVLTEWRDDLSRSAQTKRSSEAEAWFVNRVSALTYALSQVWVPQDVAQAALPLVERALDSAKFTDSIYPNKEPRAPRWQDLVDALGGK